MLTATDCVINAVVCALREAFDPDSTHPPLGGGTTKVRLFAGEGSPLEAVDLHNADPQCGCQVPFVWVRLMRRYRTDRFPEPFVGDAPCGKPVVIAVEVGVARCAAVVDPECGWSDYEREAEVSMDDSWRIELALCRAATLIKAKKCGDMAATDAILPVGPEGGVIAWLGTLYAQLAY